MWVLLFVLVFEKSVVLDAMVVSDREDCLRQAKKAEKILNQDPTVKAFELACKQLKIA